jgi:hypothetical protein
VSVVPSSTRPTKIPVVVYAFHAEGYGGFTWAPDTEDNRVALRDELILDLTCRSYETGTLVSLSVPDLAPSMVTDLLEGELQDAIEVGSVGHIITRFYTTA